MVLLEAVCVHKVAFPQNIRVHLQWLPLHFHFIFLLSWQCCLPISQKHVRDVCA